MTGTPDTERSLDPTFAFLLSLIGVGYLYVGQLWLGVSVILAVFVAHALIGWTGLIFQPVGIYAWFALLALVIFLQLIFPAVIAWRRKTAPLKRYNRWYIYLAWAIGLQVLVGVWALHRSQIGGYNIFSIPSESMAPVIERGDWITANTWRYRKQGPQVGEIVVFVHEGSEFVKRIAGTPGDTVEVRNGILYRNQVVVNEPYLHSPLPDLERPDAAPITLGANEYYVLGDFRDQSRDSRIFGPIKRDQVLGRVELLCFSRQGWRVGWNRFPRDLADGSNR